MKKNKFVALIVMLMFALIMSTPSVEAKGISDIEGHWAEIHIKQMTSEGIISGYNDGTFNPDGKITRAEFATLIVKGFKLSKNEGKTFNDTKDHWAKDFIAIANASNIVNGYNETVFGADDPITREQMAVMIVKAAKLTSKADAKEYIDNQSISEWAKEAVATASANQLITGYTDNTFKPQTNASRAEAAVVLAKGINLSGAEDIDFSSLEKAGTYGPQTGSKTVTGNVTVKTKGVILQNLIIKGELIIAKEVGNGDVNLNNIIVEGTTYIRGGGINSIHINGGQYKEIIVEKTANGAVRIVAVNVAGLSVTVAQDAKGEEVVLNGDINKVTIKADDVKIVIQGETKVGEIKINSGLKDVKIELAKESTVKEMILDSKTEIKGEGKTEKASGSKAKESSFTTAPKVITGTSSGGGGSSGGTSSVAVSTVSISGTPVIGQTLTAVASGQPGITAAYKWMRADAADGTYADIPSAANKTYVLTNDDLDKYLKVEVTGTGSYTGTALSAATAKVKEVSSITIKSQPTKLTYVEGQSLNLAGLEITLNYSDSTTEDITLADFAAKNVTANPTNDAVLGAGNDGTSVVVSAYGKTANTDNLTVAAKTVDELIIKAQPAKLSYVEGQALNLNGLVVTLKYNDGDEKDVAAADFVTNSISTSPSNGTALVIGTHNSQPIVVSRGAQNASTDNLTVVAKAVTGISINNQPTKLNYVEGQKLDLTGLEATLAYNDDTTENVAYAAFTGKGITTDLANGTDLTIASHNNKPIIITYNAMTANTNNIVVVAKAVESISIKEQPTKLSYKENQALALAGLEVTLTYNDGTTEDVAFANFGTEGITTAPTNGTLLTISGHNGKPIAISYNGKTVNTSNIIVLEKEVTGISIESQPTKLSYVEGQNIDLSGLSVKLTYDNGTDKDVAAADFAANAITTSPDISTALTIASHNNNPITVNCNGKTATTSNITVVAKEVTGISVKTQPKLDYVAGQSLDLSALVVTLSYNDISNEDVAFGAFGGKSISVSIANGTALDVGNNGSSITVTCNSIDTNTDKLSVVAKAVTGISIKTQPTKLNYVEEQNLALAGLEVTLTYNDGLTKEVAFADFGTDGISASPADGTVLALADNNKPVMVTCNSKTANTNNLVVAAKAVSSITINSQPTKLSYIEGQNLDLTGLVVTLNYNDSTSENVATADFFSKGISANPASGAALTIAHNNQPIAISRGSASASTNNLTVAAKQVTGISVVTQPKLTYRAGKNLDLSNLVVNLVYDNGTNENVAFANFTAKGITADPANNTVLSVESHHGKPVAVSCNSKTANTSNLTVEAAPDKSDLQTAVTAANTNKNDTKTSTDGSEFYPVDRWVNTAAMTSYAGAITAAQTVLDNEDATATEVTDALTALGTATTTFNDAKMHGTKVVTFDLVYYIDSNGDPEVKYSGKYYKGIEEPGVGGVYNICLDKTKVFSYFGDVTAGELVIWLDGAYLKDGDKNIELKEVHIVAKDVYVYVLAAVQQSNNDHTTINPSTIGQLQDSTATHAAEIRFAP